GGAGDGTPAAPGPPAECLGSLAWVVVRMIQQGKRTRDNEGCTNALKHASADQCRQTSGRSANDRGDSENKKSRSENPFVSKAISGSPGAKKKTGKSYRVGIDDPLEVAEPATQSRSDWLERDINDGNVEQNDDAPQANNECC